MNYLAATAELVASPPRGAMGVTLCSEDNWASRLRRLGERSFCEIVADPDKETTP